jgi:NhaP-type Na+/H+ or K+/H+ antiporter
MPRGGRDWNTLARTGPGVVALGAVMLCYGAVELAEGYGFIGVFVAGVVCRRAKVKHDVHRRLHVFSESIEHALTAILLFLLGGALPTLWPALDWRHSVIGFGLIVLIRPLAARLCLAGTDLSKKDRWLVSFFGIRGIGSIYYVGYASSHVEFVNEDQIWALIAFTIFASTVIHGFLVPLVASDRQ